MWDLALFAGLGVAIMGFGGIAWTIIDGRESFNACNLREFEGRLNRFLESAPPELTGNGAKRLRQLVAGRRRNALATAADYFDICSEQYWLAMQGRIERSYWQIGLEGLKRRIAAPIWQDCWRELADNYRHNPEFYEFVWMGMPERHQAPGLAPARLAQPPGAGQAA